MRRNPGWGDVPALLELIRSFFASDHTSCTPTPPRGDAGARRSVDRRIGPGRRPILVHTFHGHSLTGYFAPRTAAIYRRIERWLAPRTDALVAVSAEVRDELIGMGVADATRFVVIPLGFDLRSFEVDPAERTARRHTLRRELGIAADERLVTLIARLVPIKRVDRFLRVARELAAARPDLHFLVVGDGELRRQLQASPEATELDGRLTWAGFRRDIPTCASRATRWC